MPYIALTLPPGLKLRLLRLARKAGLPLLQYIVELAREAEARRRDARSAPKSGKVSVRQLWELKRAAQAREHKLAAQGRLTTQSALLIPVSEIRGAKVTFRKPTGCSPSEFSDDAIREVTAEVIDLLSSQATVEEIEARER